MNIVSELSKEDWFKLAAIVDPGYKGKEDVFNVAIRASHFTLSTEIADQCNVIRVCFEDDRITKIVRIGSDTSDWTEIPGSAYSQIRKEFKIQTNLLTDDRKVAVQSALDDIERLKSQMAQKCETIKNVLGGIIPESTKVHMAMEGPHIWDYRRNQYGYNITFDELYAYLAEHNRDHLKETDWAVLDDLPF